MEVNLNKEVSRVKAMSVEGTTEVVPARVIETSANGAIALIMIRRRIDQVITIEVEAGTSDTNNSNREEEMDLIGWKISMICP